jgi:uncharacterized membrane protein YkoI
MKAHQIVTAIAVALISHAAFGEEADTPVKFANLPAPAAKAIKAAAGDTILKNLVSGDEDGIQAYEAAWNAGGHKHEIAVTKDGKVLGQEEITTRAEAPEAIQTTIKKIAGEHKVIEVEKVLTNGVTTYEFTYKNNHKETVVKLKETGEVLSKSAGEQNL